MDEERLIIALEARVNDFIKNMQKASRTGAQSFDAIERRAKQSGDRLESLMASASSRVASGFKNFGAGFIGGLTAGGIEGLVKGFGNMAKGIASIGDEAKRAGLSMKSFQELKFVAEQNRIGVDALTDGFKELNIRADEFIDTGAGSGAEAFRTLGFTAADLSQKLRDPSALFSEIIGKLQQLDRASQIRIMDELFGGTGGEQFVQLIEQGEKGIRATIKAANDLGVVMDDELIRRADELDRKFNALTTAVGSGLKQAFVEAGLALQDFAAQLEGVLPTAQALGGAGAGRVSMPASASGFLPNFAATAGDMAQLDADRSAILTKIKNTEALYNAARDNGGDATRKADLEAQLSGLRKQLGAVEDQITAQKQLNEEKEKTVELDEVIVTAPKSSTGGPARYRQPGELPLPANTDFTIEHRQLDLDRDPPDVSGVSARAGEQAGESMAVAFIKRFEGFRPDAYWDVNAFRTGYGSDTATRADGSVEKVTASTIVSLADANRDLARRIIDFQSGIRGKIGADTFASFSEEQQAALTSISYNYGELPDRIVAAIRAGSPEGVGVAIRDLGDDNGGINSKRRSQEADLFFSGSGSGATPAMTAATAGLQRQEKAALALQQRYSQLGQIGATAFQGIANALSDGEISAQEMLGIVSQLIQQLLSMPSLQDGSLFAGAGAGAAAGAADPWAGMRSAGGFGFFGKLLGGLFGFSEGGYTGSGGKHDAAGIVHKGEVVWSQRDVAKAGGVANVEAMRKGKAPGYADGGVVRDRRDPAPAPTPDTASTHRNRVENETVSRQDREESLRRSTRDDHLSNVEHRNRTRDDHRSTIEDRRSTRDHHARHDELTRSTRSDAATREDREENLRRSTRNEEHNVRSTDAFDRQHREVLDRRTRELHGLETSTRRDRRESSVVERLDRERRERQALDVTERYIGVRAAPPPAKLPAYADGGRVRGPGGPREDRIHALLSAGEFVVNAEATTRHLHLLEQINGNALPGFAEGGLVRPAALPQLPALASPRGSLSQGEGIEGTGPITINAPITVQGSSGTPEQNADLAKQMGKQLEGTMRGIVVDEILRQRRPGNALNRRG